jgi:hypothetical protein
MRGLVATLAAVALLAAVAVADASGMSSRTVIVYVDWHAGVERIYVTGPGGAHELGNGQGPSVAPDGRMVSSSAIGESPALTLYRAAGGRLHSFFRDRSFVTPLAWSSDSRYLAVELGARPDGSAPVIASAGLAVIDTKTMTARTIASGVITGASFAPSGPDRLVYGYETGSTRGVDAVTNLYTINAHGSNRTQLTSDGNSLQPLWTAKGIVYDRETRRGAGALPSYELWLLHDGHSTQLTARASVAEIVPVAASANGNRLIAEYDGTGVSRPLAVQLSPRWISALATGGATVWGAGISRDGRTLLLERAASGPPTPSSGLQPFPPHDDLIETAPFGGGKPTRIVGGDSAAWNG